jgi:hypothetical protein
MLHLKRPGGGKKLQLDERKTHDELESPFCPFTLRLVIIDDALGRRFSRRSWKPDPVSESCSEGQRSDARFYVDLQHLHLERLESGCAEYPHQHYEHE